MNTTQTLTPVSRAAHAAVEATRAEPRPMLSLHGVTVRLGGTTILDRVDVALPAGALVAVAGGSGAGKTTLLEVLAGLRRPTAGTVDLGAASTGGRDSGAVTIGVVPQDDIIHRDLPLRRTLVHAARLRLPRAERARAEEIVDETLGTLGLTARAGVPVGSLSGGQRKRASIAVELLTHPRVLLLDEPTSGLDPLSAGEVMTALRSLVDRGISVVLTTHHPADIERCDHVLFLARGGRVAFSGAPREARASYGVDDIGDVYRHLDQPVEPPVDRLEQPVDDAPTATAIPSQRLGASGIRQWRVLSQRSAEVMVRSRLTLAILLGSPALVITMMAVLFPANAFDAASPTAMGPPLTVFWMAFAAFFFGLTYGLLQIVTERSVLRRERFAGLSLVAYLGSKVALLMPVLIVIVATLFGVMRYLDRLPAVGWSSSAELLITLSLTAAAGLAIGLAASAAVADPTQATLALPMICFPQVLFAGAVVPVTQMASAGAAMSVAMANRWSFEALGRTLLRTTDSGSPSAYAEAFDGSPQSGWLVLVIITAICSGAALLILRARTSRPRFS